MGRGERILEGQKIILLVVPLSIQLPAKGNTRYTLPASQRGTYARGADRTVHQWYGGERRSEQNVLNRTFILLRGDPLSSASIWSNCVPQPKSTPLFRVKP